MPEQREGTRQYTVSSLNTTEEKRLQCVLDNLADNKVFAFLPADKQSASTLQSLKERYAEYRKNWRDLPEQTISQWQKTGQPSSLHYPPLCVDIEVAAICDLACPFCYRQHIATPDGIIKKELFFRVIDQCVEMGVPSIKLNWRGEALLHPALPEFISYAKEHGILEVLLNTNAVTLTEEKSRALVHAGLDVLIYSFDGGTAETYNRMRPGRFRENRFENVYENIKTFAAVRNNLDTIFPRTRIQMIITEESADEIDSFHQLFAGIVDDVSTKAYSERGGDMSECDSRILQAVQAHFQKKGEDFLIDPTKIWLTSDKKVFYATGRLPCQQLFQRLVITYDGRVHMCCYDWAGAHTIGFVDERAYTSGDHALKEAVARSSTVSAVSERIFEPEYKVQHLNDIWNSDHLQSIRHTHCQGTIQQLAPCRDCNFRDTYTWEEIEVFL